MLDKHQILKLKTFDGGDVEFEVNFSKHKDIDGCKVIRFRYGDTEFDITQKELVTALLVIGTDETQKSMLPMQKTRIRKLERLLTFQWTASENYQKGDVITVQAPWIDTLPDVEELFGGNVTAKKPKARSSKFLMK